MEEGQRKTDACWFIAETLSVRFCLKLFLS